MDLQLDTDIQYIKGVGPERAKLLHRLGIHVVEDLLYFLPFRYEDRSRIRTIKEVLKDLWKESDKIQTLQGRIISSNIIVTPRQGKKIFEISISDNSGYITARWFNQVYLKDILKRGKFVVLSGYIKIDTYAGIPYMESPEFEIIDSGEEDLIHTGRIVPFYHLTNGLSQKMMRKIVYTLLRSSRIPEILPDRIIKTYKLPMRDEAIRNVHFPPENANVDEYNRGISRAHKRLIFEELFLLQLGLMMKKISVERERGIPFFTEGPLFKKLINSLPFRLTNAQQRVLDEIKRDMSSIHPMNRLLQGDVGSGKTVVALLAMIIAVDNGYQAALMAPTEILAEQHYKNIRKYLASINVQVDLVTGKLRAREREGILSRISQGETNIVIGTHALLEEGVVFKNLGLAIIDEQHKFGVIQRSSLKKKGYNPDVLVMTATPIPRTLAMSIYGDLELSIIDELPPGRMPVVTRWLYGESRKQAYYIMKEELKKNHQIYVVYPLIEESDRIDLRAATEMAMKLQKAFPGYQVGLLHGRMKPSEKEEIMELFKEKKIHILVSTTVIEVGIDIPDATVIIVEHAERFGLAQLHQLRGRVGRGNKKSYCLLLTDENVTDTAVERLRAMEATNNGFDIAEKDLIIRGPGELFGIKQSGLPGLKISNLLRDIKIMELARKEAEALIKGDPLLEHPEHKSLKHMVEKRWENKLELATVS